MSVPDARLAEALADRYRLDRELGRGGVATVYLARDLRHDRDVALKVLDTGISALVGEGRFHQEIMVTARQLSDRFGRHPWILMAISIAAGMAGELGTAETVYQEAKGRAALEYVQRPILAVAALNAGRRDEAYEQLHAAVRERDALFAALALDWPGFDALRKTPEYDSVLREMGWDRTLS